MSLSRKIKRRKFISKSAKTAAAFTIIPAHVLAGSGTIPPSDKITVANIGCGTQGLRELGEMLEHQHLQVVSVCDPNKFSTDYVDWSPNGLRNGIRKILDDKSWGETHGGIAGGRDVAEQYVNQYYTNKKSVNTYKACSSYEDYRELLQNEDGIDVVKIMTPDHLHAAIAIAAMKAGKHVVTHKPIANRMMEGRKTIEMAKKSDVKTHLLAWGDKPEYAMIRQWIADGVIGQLREIHNWSYRPVWPQWTSPPTDRPSIPDGFNWDLWLGPVPDRPYHPNYTHNVFRGWYDFGGGSIADMGHYSLFPLFQELGINTAPVSAQAYGSTTRTVVDSVCKTVDNKDAFPGSSIIRLKFPKQDWLPSFDLYWYDGGMKPFAPKDLEDINRDLGREGLMFVGEKGKILAGFEGANPEILPIEKMKAYRGIKSVEPSQGTSDSDPWVKSIKDNTESPGSFIHAGPVTETINLAAIALRVGEKINYDSSALKITNNKEANKYLTRSYREGWEM